MARPFRIRDKNDAAQSAAVIGGGAVVGGVLGRVIGGNPVTVTYRPQSDTTAEQS